MCYCKKVHLEDVDANICLVMERDALKRQLEEAKGLLRKIMYAAPLMDAGREFCNLIAKAQHFVFTDEPTGIPERTKP